MSSPDKPVLKVAPCDHAAAKYAVENWHYSQVLPAGKLFKVGAWEGGKFIGCVIFSYGANNNIGSPYGLAQTEVCELVRVALRAHVWPVSRIMRFAMKMLKEHNPGTRLCISYADPEQGHHGGVYQATGWAYTGASKSQREVMHNGKVMHKRTANALFGTIKGMEKSHVMWKHKYLYPLDEAMKRKIEPLRKPYPKRAGSSSVEHSDSIGEVGGSIPTPALNSSKSCVSEN